MLFVCCQHSEVQILMSLSPLYHQVPSGTEFATCDVLAVQTTQAPAFLMKVFIHLLPSAKPTSDRPGKITSMHFVQNMKMTMLTHLKLQQVGLATCVNMLSHVSTV